MVSSVTLAFIRRRVAEFLTDSCRIEQRSGTVGELGTPVAGWRVVDADVPCRVIKGQSEIGRGGEQVSIVDEYTLITPVGTSLAVDYRVVMADGTIYQIVEVIDGRTDAVDAQAKMRQTRDG